jgi:putative transposase
MEPRDRQASAQMGLGSARRRAATLPQGFIVLPRRWVIERTFAWILRNRRMSRDYEFLAETTEALIYLAMIRLMVSRLAKGPREGFSDTL